MARTSLTGYNIYLRKDGRWEGRNPTGTENGRTVYNYIYAGSYDEAVSKLDKITMEREELPVRQKGTEFTCIATEWLSMQKPQLKPASLSCYTHILNGYLNPQFGDRNISDISRLEVITFIHDLLENGGSSRKGLSTSSVHSIFVVVKNIFRYALREKGLSVADLDGILVKQARSDPPTLSRDEQETLVQWLCSNLTPCNLGILLSLFTGLRLGEVCALKWKDISKVDQSITVCQSMQRVQRIEECRTEIVTQTPKSTSSIRRVPVTGDMARLLSANRQADDAYLLTGKKESFVEPRTLQRRFKSVLKECGLGDINFHALRHTFATRAIEVGFDPKTLSLVLGHATVSMTLNRYVHPGMEEKQRNMNLLSGILPVQQADCDQNSPSN